MRTLLRGFKNFLMQGDLIVIAAGLVVALAADLPVAATRCSHCTSDLPVPA